MPPQTPGAANAAKPTQNPPKPTTRYLRTAFRVIAALCTVTLSCLAVVWGIKSYNATQFGNLLQQQESCRQHPRDVVLQAKPICQEMRMAGDFDPPAKRDSNQPHQSAFVLIAQPSWIVLYEWLKTSARYLYDTCGRYLISFGVMLIMPREDRLGSNWKIRILAHGIFFAAMVDIIQLSTIDFPPSSAVVLWTTFMLVYILTEHKSSPWARWIAECFSARE
ncbi:hypothetical protein FB567DRAFT_80004 [Paraphoma chrysanthemicola]|uniref:Uncharacterized protein n=1 Tax=Paraphoma chrysanthemicola TaxID=798071 RepID=A0A8K0VX88_9PLEO|nr:hypothetical protein FB567DRAFT_80004 [Paraphoma chrysanthemicola]